MRLNGCLKLERILVCLLDCICRAETTSVACHRSISRLNGRLPYLFFGRLYIGVVPRSCEQAYERNADSFVFHRRVRPASEHPSLNRTSHYPPPSPGAVLSPPSSSAFSASVSRCSSGRIHVRKAMVIRLPPAI